MAVIEPKNEKDNKMKYIVSMSNSYNEEEYLWPYFYADTEIKAIEKLRELGFIQYANTEYYESEESEIDARIYAIPHSTDLDFDFVVRDLHPIGYTTLPYWKKKYKIR